MYMNDDGRLFIIVIKFYLMFYNGWFVYVISEKIKIVKIIFIEYYLVIVYFDIDILYI